MRTAALFLVAVAALLPSAVSAQERLTGVAEQVNRKMVKLFGAGGFKGLPSYGTGVLVSPVGHILTVNNHILTTVDLRVHLADGRLFHAKVLAKEPELDIALCKIEEPVEGLPYFDFATAATRPVAETGTWVAAFSNQFQIATRDEPMSIQRSVIASYSELRGRRGVFDAPYNGHVYFLDAIACNPGSAGGAVTTRKGELLGLLGRELKNTLTDTWINYAVPIQAKAEIVRKDKTVAIDMAGFVREAMAGTYKQSEAKKTKDLAAGGFHGIILVPNVVTVTPPYVEDVLPESPAAKVGLQPDDLIVYVEGELVQSIKSFREIMAAYNPNQDVRLDIQRGSRLMSVTIKLGPQPKQANP